jgi:hypothetical protein
MICVDSGASKTYVRNNNILYNYFVNLTTVSTAEQRSVLERPGTGATKIQKLTIDKACYCPKMALNLLSVSQLCDMGLNVLYTPENCVIAKQKETLLIAKRIGDLYRVELNNYNCEYGLGVSTTNKPMTVTTTILWQRRMGHLNFSGLLHLQSFVDGLVIGPIPHEQRECCLRTKLTRKSFKPSTSHARRPGELLHSDIMEFAIKSLRGFKYMISFIDDYSIFITVYILKQKSDAYDAFVTYDSRFNNMYRRHVTTIRADGRSNPKGAEYHSSKMSDYCNKHGICHQFTCAHTPEENARAERVNRTIM